VPVRINKEKQIDLFKKYAITWTPTIVILDTEGKEHFRFTGFLPPSEFSAAIILDGAKTELDLQNYDLAIKCCNEVIEKYKGTIYVPEAIFYLSVAKYLSTHDAKNLRAGYDRLTKEFPGSEWTHKATPYKLIDK
jgi:thioredoxin-related protein